MMELLKDLSKKGRTIVVVTHAMENLDKCDRVAFLGRGGRLCGYGAAKDAFRWFNKRSYSRIFAMLAEEEASEAFAKKYRCSAQYRETYAAFCAEYGAGACCRPKRKRRPPRGKSRRKSCPRQSVRRCGMKKFKRRSARMNAQHFRVLTRRYFRQIFSSPGTLLPSFCRRP